MVEPILAEFGAAVARLRLAPPAIPFLSNVTGAWIRDEEATDPDYWVRQLRQTVRFGDGVAELLCESQRVLLEVGPGQTLGTLAMQHPGRGPRHLFLSSLRHPQDRRPDEEVLLAALGELWLGGVSVDWRAFWAGERRRRVPLPPYPFERRRHWIELAAQAAGSTAAPARRPDLASWFYVPGWRQGIPAAALPRAAAEPPGRWLLLLDGHGLGAGLAARLERRGCEVATAVAGPGFARRPPHGFAVSPHGREDLGALLGELDAEGRFPDTIVHLWSVGAAGAAAAAGEPEAPAAGALELGFHSLAALAQALGRWPAREVRVVVVSTGVQAVTGAEELSPEKAALLGAVRVVPQEMPRLSWRSVDVEMPAAGGGGRERQIDRLLDELLAADPGADVAHRGDRRWVQAFEPLRLERRDGAEGAAPRLRERGVYLVTGGLGGVALELASFLAAAVHARLVLTTRSPLPPRAEWEAWLAGDGGREADGERTARRLRKLLAIEALGGEVTVTCADAADLDAMRGALTAARRELGALHGVIHAAGVVAGGMVEWKTREAATAVLAPKLGGARVLARLLAGVELNFVVLCSAANSALGGFGQADLCAASAALDAAAFAWPGPAPCLAIDWDTWRDVGAAAEVEVPPDLAELHREALRHGMSATEGVEAFARLLGAGLPRVVVSTRDLPALLAQAARRGGEDPLAGLPAAPPAVSTQARPALRTLYVAPRGEVEQAVAALWQEMMGIEQVGAHDSFFELGGHSLLATRIVSRLRDSFAAELPIAGFFEAPTVAGLAAAVERARVPRPGGEAAAAGGLPPAAAIERIPGEKRDSRAVPLTVAQQRLSFLDQLEPGGAGYNMPLFLRLRGRLALPALRQAFAELERRHETLRTTFTLDADGEQPVQAVSPARGMALPLADLAGLPAAAGSAALARLLAAAAERPFDLARGPLCRALLVRLGEREHALLLALHHIVCDGWSLGILVREVAALYAGRAGGRPAALPPLPVQYADFAVWQRRQLGGETLARQLEYSRAQLAGSPPLLDLPTDRPRPALQSLRGRTLPLPIPDRLWSGTRALARQCEATPFMVLLAAWKALLARHARQPDVVVGTPAANRGRAEIDGLIGFFVNTLVLRTDLGGDPSFAGLVARVRQVVAGAWAHQDLPFERLVDELQVERHRGHNPLFQVMFILHDDPMPGAEIGGLSLAPLEVEAKTAKFDLMLQVWEQPSGLAGFLEFHTDLFDAATIRRLGEQFETLLAAALAAPEGALAALPALPAASRHQLVMEWNDAAAGSGTASRAVPAARCLHHLFAAQAERSPGAAALVWDGGTWSYDELGRRAARLARRLRRLGVGPDVPVAICLRRSPQLAVAVLGVLAAGGAYVPLDPEFPRQRLATMLELAAARVLLTERDLLGAFPGAVPSPADGPAGEPADGQADGQE